MRRAAFILCAIWALTPFSATAQSPDPQALADVRSEMATLYNELTALRALTAAQGGGNTAALSSADVPVVLRLDRLEEELRALTGQVESLTFRIDQIAQDGTRRIGDLEFRLVELEGGDVTAIGETTLLGGEVPDSGAAMASVAPQPEQPAVQLAISEKSDFENALERLKDGEVDAAITGFQKFLADYPGGPLTAEAMFHIGEAKTQIGEHKMAAKAYLDSFTSAPNGPLAANALMKVGLALGQLGQPAEACQTLDEVLVRYPGSAIEPELMSNRQALGCS